LDILLIKNP